MSERSSHSASRRPATARLALDADAVAAIAGEVTNPARLRRLAGLTTLAAPQDDHLVFLDRYDDALLERIAAYPATGTLFVLPPEYRGRVDDAAVFTPFPREAFSRLAVALFDYDGSYWEGFEDSATAEARMPGVRIFPGCQIHGSAQFGPGSRIFPGTVVGPNVKTGERTIIKPNCVIGFPGYGIHRGAEQRNLHLPHVGGVVIGDDVEIGALNTICSGTIHPTIIEDEAKFDDHVHVAHNCHVGHGARVTAHVEMSGSVVVGRDAWLAPNISILESVVIGENAFVGIGATVIRDVPADTLVAGSPARPLRTKPSGE